MIILNAHQVWPGSCSGQHCHGSLHGITHAHAHTCNHMHKHTQDIPSTYMSWIWLPPWLLGAWFILISDLSAGMSSHPRLLRFLCSAPWRFLWAPVFLPSPETERADSLPPAAHVWLPFTFSGLRAWETLDECFKWKNCNFLCVFLCGCKMLHKLTN